MTDDLLLKVREAIKEPIVGNYLFSTEELEEIYSQAEILLQSFGCKKEDDYAIVFVALVNMTKEWKSEEDTFLDFIYRKFSSNYGLYQNIYSNLRTTIISLFESKKIYMIEWGKRFYATLCSHALAPISSTESFFDMCWEIYCDDLDQQYEKTDSVYGLIVESLRNKFKFIKSLDDDIKIGSHAYSMRVGMKGLAIHAPSVLESLISETIGCIHSLFNNQPIKNDKYFKLLLNDWWKRKQLTFGTITRTRNPRVEKIVTNYSQIRARYILIDGSIQILIPSIRLLDNFEVRPYLEIFLDGELIHKEEMYMRGSGIIMSTMQREYPLDDLDIQNSVLRIVISHSGKVIYDSKESLIRDFILFKNGKEITSSECIPGQYEIYSTNLDVFLRSPIGMQKVGPNIYSFETIDGEILQSPRKTIFFFSEQTNRNLYFFVRKKNNVIYKKDDTEYQVIDGELCIDVFNSMEINNYGIKYEDASFRLSDFPHESSDSKTRYEITSLLNVGEPQKIVVFKYSDNSIIACINIIKFKNISITFDKPYYYGDGDTGIVTFKTDKYFGEEAFDVSSETIAIPIEDGDLIIETPIIKWKIDDGEWHTKPSDSDLWYKTISPSSLLYIKVPKDTAFSIALSNNREMKKQGTKHIYELGSLIQSLSWSPYLKMDNFSILLKSENKEFLPLIDVVFSEKFVNNPITVYPNDFKISWDPQGFIGGSDASFIIRLYEDSKVIEEFDATLKPRVINCNDFEEGRYEVKVFLLSDLGEEKELSFTSFIFGDEKSIRFKNKTLFINTVVTIDKALFRRQIRPILIDNINYLGTKEGFDYYSGYLFVIDKNGQKIYLDKMRDSSGKVSIINPIRIELKTSHSCYIGYGLDLDDDEFEYDNEFSVDYLGKTVVGNYSDGKRTSPIDYYIFDIKKNLND